MSGSSTTLPATGKTEVGEVLGHGNEEDRGRKIDRKQRGQRKWKKKKNDAVQRIEGHSGS